MTHDFLNIKLNLDYVNINDASDFPESEVSLLLQH